MRRTLFDQARADPGRLSRADIERTEEILSAMKDNLRRSITDSTEVDLPIGVFEEG